MKKWATGIVYILVFGVMAIPVVCLAGINDELAEAVKNNNIQEINELISRGADVNAIKGSYGWIPLFYAARYGKNEIVKLLLDRGADVNAKDSYGWTPLLYAAAHGKNEIVKLLLDRGADVNVKANDGKTALSIAESSSYIKFESDIAKLLREAGAK